MKSMVRKNGFLIRVAAAVIAALFAVAPLVLLSGCGGVLEADYTLACPDGAPLLAVADMWGDSDSFSPASLGYELTAEDQLSVKFTAGSDAVILAPLNVGANFHNAYLNGTAKTDYKLLNVISWGVLYFTSNVPGMKAREDCGSLNEFLGQFAGKTVKTIGLAAIPGKTADYIFKTSRINVTLEGSKPELIQQSFVKGDETIAVFAEPAITGTQSKANVNVLGSVSEVYAEITGNDFPMAGTFIRSDVLTDNPAFADRLDARIKESTEAFSANPGNAAEKIENNVESNGLKSSLKAAVVTAAASKMNVRYKSAEESREDVKKLLANIGVTAPDSLFV